MSLLTAANGALERLTGRRLQRNAPHEQFFARLQDLHFGQPATDVDAFARFVCLHFGHAHGMTFQDLWVLQTLGELRGGFFVEFGAQDGVACSNTLLLEREYDWRGIVAEPDPRCHDALRGNRPRSVVDTRCVHVESGKSVEFILANPSPLSVIAGYESPDIHPELRDASDRTVIETVSLADLLDAYNAPPVIDYLSIDTEGSEYDILAAFPFDRTVRCITVEYAEHREPIHNLLGRRGFRCVLPEVSDYESWFIHESVAAA